MRDLEMIQKSRIILYKEASIGDLEAKSSTDKYPNGYVEGYLSTFNNIDSDGDVIRKGAWAKTIKEKVYSGTVPMMKRHFLHGGGASDVIGSIKEAKEDDRGLWVRGAFSGDASSQEIREKVAGGHIRNFSAGFRIINYRQGVEHESGATVDELTELALMEGTITPFPANVEAVVTSAKAIRDTATDIGDPRLEKLIEQMEVLLKQIAEGNALLIKMQGETKEESTEETQEESTQEVSQEEAQKDDPPDTTEEVAEEDGTPAPSALSVADLMGIQAQLAEAERTLCTLVRKR